MTIQEPFLQLQASLLSSQDGGDAIRRAAVLAERILKRELGEPPGSRAGLGEMIGHAHRDDELRARLGRELIRDLNWLNEWRKKSVHDKGIAVAPPTVDDGQRAVDVVSELLVLTGRCTRDELRALVREAEWKASSRPSRAVYTLDRVKQRDAFENLVIRPRRLLAVLVHGEAGQGHEHFARVMSWRLRATPTGRWTEMSIDWPAPSEAFGIRFAYLLEGLAEALSAPVEVPRGCDPSTEDGMSVWREALAPLWATLERSRRRLYIRHSLALLDDRDPELIERYLAALWLPAARRIGERVLLSFELARAEATGLPLLARSWRLGRKERRLVERVVAVLDDMQVPDECRCQALDELTSVSEDDLVRWFRNERNQPRTSAEKAARKVIATTRGGRFELVVGRVSALVKDSSKESRR